LVKVGSKNIYVDHTFKMQLSENQLTKFAKCVRIQDICPDNPQLVADEFRYENILQGNLGTCSVISALIAVCSYDAKFGSSFIKDIFHPKVKDQPVYNSSGSYLCRIHFNGSFREIQVDDFLPVDDTGSLMCSRSVVSNEFWVSIVEKAMVKMYGDNYGGIPSSSAVEFNHLIGWIPETISFNDDLVIDTDVLWERLYEEFERGTLVSCLGTEKLRDATEDDTLGGCVSKSTGLVENHTYSVLDLREYRGLRLVKLKNPWGKVSWKGQFSARDDRNWSADLERYLKYNRIKAKEQDEGIFWMTWNNAFKYFSNLYIGWNPKFFSFQKQIHLASERQNFTSLFWNEDHCVESNPQFIIRVPPHKHEVEMRALISRHLDEWSTHDQLESEDRTQLRSTAFKVFKYEGNRISYPINPLHASPYSTMELCSDIFNFEESTRYTYYVLVILRSQFPEKITRFTLDIFSYIDLEIREMPRKFIQQSLTIDGRWLPESAGGNLLSSCFHKNPQYTLDVPVDTDFQVKLQADPGKYVMFHLVKSEGKSITEIPFQLIAKSHNPGFYFTGFASWEGLLARGTYTLIVSNQESGDLGEFHLELNSFTTSQDKLSVVTEDNQFSYKELTESSLPMKKRQEGFWTKENSKGTYRIITTKYQAFLQNPGYLFHTTKEVQLRLNLVATELANQSEIPSTCICIYEIDDQGDFQLVLEDESYANRAWGYFTPEFSIKPNKNGYLFLCINYEKGYTGKFCLDIYSDHSYYTLQEYDHFKQFNSTRVINGSWDMLRAGGCSSHPSFYLNPQYCIQVQQETEMYVQLQSNNQFPVGIYILESTGKRVAECPSEKISECFSNSTFLVELNTLTAKLMPGIKYTIVPCTFEANQMGSFRLIVCSMAKFKLEELHEARYRSKKTYSGIWNPETNFGSKKFNTEHFQEFLLNPNFHLRNPSSDKSEIRLHLMTASDISIAMFAYKLCPEGTYTKIKDTGHYSPYKMGVFLTLELDPGAVGYLIVCSTYEEDISADFKVEIEGESSSSVIVAQNVDPRNIMAEV